MPTYVRGSAGRVFPMNRETRAYLDRAAPDNRPLQAADVFRDIDGRFHMVQYVNTSGAYAVPLAGLVREINDRTVHFAAGGRTISVHSMVERVKPLSMGGNSQEYKRYVRLLAALKEGGMAKRKVDTGPKAQGATFDQFDDSEFIEPESIDAEGHTAIGDTETPNENEGSDMAKKAAKAAKAKAVKPVKKVRNCACGCGTETTGHFAPGHDARFHGWLKKLQDGRIGIDGKDAKSGEKVIPNAILKSLDLTKTKDGAKAKAPHFYKSAE